MLVTAPGELPDEEHLVDVLRRFPEVRSIHWAINDRPAEVTRDLPTRLLWGEDAIEEELCGLRFRVSPNAFLQTNTAMAERLYGLAGEYAGLSGGETVYDLYCGIGTIGLTLARDALTVWGVEASEEAVACAIENAALNGIANAAFFAGDVGRSLEELHARSGDPDVVVVDPPRAGLSGRAVRQPRPARRAAHRLRLLQPDDAGREREGARRPSGATGSSASRPVDMFPHTPHVEAVALLERVCRMFTARAATRMSVIALAPASTIITIFMRALSGITSVGLNADAVRERDVEVVEEARSPLGRGELGVLGLRPHEVGRVGRPSCRAIGPPESNSQNAKAATTIVVPSIRAAMWIRSVPLFVTWLRSRKCTSRLITHSWATPKTQIMVVPALRKTGRAASGLTSGSNPFGGITTTIETKNSVHSTGEAQRMAVKVFEWTETSLVGSVAYE